jgi:hypothetical protein
VVYGSATTKFELEINKKTAKAAVRPLGRRLCEPYLIRGLMPREASEHKGVVQEL